MKGMGTLRKSAVIAAVCMAVLGVSGYGEPTSEQIRERTKLLEQAVKNNNLEQAKLCIKLGADVNSISEHYNPILCDAVKEGNKDMVELLINSGADVNGGGYGHTALMYAAQENAADIAKLLINAGADVNYVGGDRGGSIGPALLIAAKYGSKDVAELLINAGADVNVNGGYYYDNQTALMYAAENGNKDIAELLIKAGADGYATLVWAMQKDWIDNVGAVETLIKAGADVNATDSEGLTPLTHAMLYGKDKIAEVLKAAGAKE